MFSNNDQAFLAACYAIIACAVLLIIDTVLNWIRRRK